MKISQLSHKAKITKAFLYLFAAFIFMGENVLSTLNINQNIWLYIVLFFCMYYTVSKWQFYKEGKGWLFFVIFIVANFLYRSFIGGFTVGIGVHLWIPAFFIGIFTTLNKTDNRWRVLMKILIFFYLIETIWAITEKISGVDFLQWGGGVMKVTDIGAADFRSYGLWGHPLYNALIVSTIMTFILTSSFNNKYKYGLWMLGYISILCFNTRGSMVGNALVLIAYLSYQIFISRNISFARKTSLFLIGSVCTMIGLYLVQSRGLGGRLVENGLYDESSQVRIDVFRIFDYINDDILYYGTDVDSQLYLMQLAGLYASENFWIDYILTYGIVFFLGYLILFLIWASPFFDNYKFIQKSFVVGTFVLLASTNNSLSSDISALLIFLSCAFIFDPKYFKLRVNPKYTI